MTFIVIEGQDYVGKTTQVEMLIAALVKEKYNVFRTRSPGGCADAEAVRDFMLNSKSASPDLRNILAALSRKLTSEVINNFLKETPTYNKVVISDRWITSGYAYQVAGEGVHIDKFLQANKDLAIPTLEIRLLMSEKHRTERKSKMLSTNRDVMELAESEVTFAQRVQKIFENKTVTFAHKTVFITVTPEDTIEEIHGKILPYVWEHLA